MNSRGNKIVFWERVGVGRNFLKPLKLGEFPISPNMRKNNWRSFGTNKFWSSFLVSWFLGLCNKWFPGNQKTLPTVSNRHQQLRVSIKKIMIHTNYTHSLFLQCFLVILTYDHFVCTSDHLRERRLLPRFSMATRSRIIAMVGSKHRRKMSRTTWGWEKTERSLRVFGECLWEATPFCKVLRCSKLKGKLHSKKKKKKQMSLWSHIDILFLLMHLQNSCPWIFTTAST